MNGNKTPLATEPALTFGVIAAAIVALLGIFGIVLDVSTVELIVAALVPLVTGALTRGFVTPIGRG